VPRQWQRRAIAIPARNWLILKLTNFGTGAGECPNQTPCGPSNLNAVEVNVSTMVSCSRQLPLRGAHRDERES